MKPLRVLVYIFITLSSFFIQAEPYSDLIINSSISHSTLLVSQGSNTLLLSCSATDANIKTIFSTSTPYAYYADDSLLIVNLNGVHCQMPGQSSASTFVSTEGCEPEKSKMLREEFLSNNPLHLGLEAVSMSSGKSSMATFNIDAEAEELKAFFNQCQNTTQKNAS